MKKENAIKKKSYGFALRIIKLCLWLRDNKHYEISNQLLRSGTSIGANVEEALAGHSRKDFLHKITIASKEARETNYWLRLMRDSDMIAEAKLESLLLESETIINILYAIVKTTSSNNFKLKTKY